MKNTTNAFSGGLTTDLHPLSVLRNLLTDALNATFITYNGNELALQNDMGNTRIQDRVTGSIMGLKEGFIPLGMKEYGGVLYIASYNPTTKTSELGTIPSPLFDYTQSLSDVYNSHNIELFNSVTFSVCDYPIILDSKKYLYYAGDSIVCGLDITNCNQSLKRVSGALEFEYPIISTRAKAGLITLHALSVPSNSLTFVDLLLHTFKYGTNEQWFYNIIDGKPADKNIIVYPNILSGSLAVKPVVETISNVKVLLNAGTGRPEPYYVKIPAIGATITYRSINLTFLQFQTLSSDSCFIPINGSIQQDPGITLVSDSEPVNVVSLEAFTITIVKPTYGRTRKVYENGICTSTLTNTDNDKSISITESINIDIIDEIGLVVIPSLPSVPKA